MKTLLQLSIFCSLLIWTGNVNGQADIRISAVYDGPLAGGTPKGVELYTCAPISDLSMYGIASANNGSGPNAFPEYVFPSISLPANTYFYVAYEAVEFQNFFGFAPDQTANAMLIDGNDAIELFYGTTVIDVFGDVNQDGAGQPWEYTDGWAYRISGTGPDGNTFDINNWTFSGPNALDGETTNASAANPVPIGTFACTAASLTATATGGNACPGDMINFTGSASGGTAPYSYSWDFGDGNTSTQQNPSHSYAVSGTYTVTLLVTDNVGGTANDVISVTVYDEPVAGFNYALANGGCAPETATFTDASTINSGSIVSWDWVFTGGTPGTGTGQNPGTVTYSNAGSYNVILTATSDQGCQDTAMASFIISDPADATIAAAGPYCENDAPVTLTATDPGGTWSATCGGCINGSTGEFDPATAGSGTHTITYTISGACGDSDTEDITVDPQEDASFSYIDSTLCDDDNSTYAANISGTVGGTFTATGGLIIDPNTGEFTPSSNSIGTYTITYTTGGNCSDTQDLTISIDDCSSIGEWEMGTIAVFPNPTTGNLRMTFEHNVSGTVEVFDVVGSRVLEAPVSGNMIEMNVSTLTSGNYTVRLINEDRVYSGRFIKR